MIDYTELVKDLRDTERVCRDRMDGQVMLDAAAAIEELIKVNRERTELYEDAVKQIPKHGEWIKNEGRCGWHCSCCKVDNNFAYSWNSETGKNEFQDNYCPNCGAKMEVQDD